MINLRLQVECNGHKRLFLLLPLLHKLALYSRCVLRRIDCPICGSCHEILSRVTFVETVYLVKVLGMLLHVLNSPCVGLWSFSCVTCVFTFAEGIEAVVTCDESRILE